MSWLSDPAISALAVTPSDTVNIFSSSSGVTRGIYVGATGNIVAVFKGGASVTFSNVPTGTVLPIQVIRINSTNTTASALLALY